MLPIITSGNASCTAPGAPLNPYFSLLRTNRNYRLLYIGQTISQLGDWFNAVAVFALLLDLTGLGDRRGLDDDRADPADGARGAAGRRRGDRVDRRKLMIAADVVRGCLILACCWSAAAIRCGWPTS